MKKIIIGLALAAAVAGSVVLYLSRAESEPNGAGSSERRVNVVLTRAAEMDFERVIVLQGNIQAERSAMVSPRIPGVLDEIFVDEGDEVVAGETELFQTDALRLIKRVEIARHRVAIGQSSLAVARASLRRDQADHSQAVVDTRRYEELRERNVATDYEFETQETKLEKSAAAIEYAQANVALAQADLEGMRSALQMAEKDLADSLVLAPIDGHVCRRMQELGEMGTPGVPVLRIEDSSALEVSLFLAAEAYGLVREGETTVQVQVNGVDLGELGISYKSPTIHSKLRTFEIKCPITAPPASVAPGAIADVTVVLRRARGLGIPSDAIQERGGQAVVFVVNNERAHMIPVTKGMVTDGMTEVTSQTLQDGSEVVAMGGFLLNDNSSVRVVQGAE